MKSEQLINLHATMRSIKELTEDFFPQLTTMNEDTWEKSNHGSTANNDLCSPFNYLDGNDKAEISNSLRDLPGEDLIEAQGISEKEMNTRRGLQLMLQAGNRLSKQIEDSTRNLRKMQAIREFGHMELERRARANAISAGGGVPLDQFCARYIFGPPPGPIVPPVQKNQNLGPKKREWFTARVKSGKMVAVETIRFDIPAAYEYWLVGELKAVGLYKNSTYHGAPHLERSPSPAIARVYYKLGFVPSGLTTLYYQISWYDQSWRNGWSFSHSREVKTNELTPVD